MTVLRKFMVVPNYTYLKLKMPDPCRVITVSTSFQRTYECEVQCYGHTSTIITSEELTIIKEGTVEEAPDSKRSARSFEPTEDVKEVLIDPAIPRARWCASTPRSPPNRKVCSSTFSAPTEISLRRNPQICQKF
jgi:hypothetical protein